MSKHQESMAFSGKSVDEVRSWIIDNGFAEYGNKFHGKWKPTKVVVNIQYKSLRKLFSMR